ncbi:sugar ABC transporter ATP-binding protein [Candidatus Sumerlaeota bacterium]|nr:sugar ABC transporter ATP-binding protein [Candidatus Sumerlaeota bacterium]
MSTQAAPRLEMEGINKSFGATAALRGVNLTLFPGEVLALIGENGAGKSTLMKILSGALLPDTGTIRLDRKAYQPRNPLHARASSVAMIYQELSLAPHLSVMENILLGIEPAHGPLIRWGEMRRRAVEALVQVGLDGLSPDCQVRKLSIAQQQLVEIARAVALNCRLLVLDEPTSSLTQTDIEKLFALIRRLRGEGVSIIYISHFLEEVREISDRFTVLRDGQTVGYGDTTDTTDEQLIAMMVGREVEDLYPRSARKTGETVLEIKGLSGAVKPDDVHLTLKRGEILGIAGLVGSGRTEFMRAIFGLDPIRCGDVTINGVSEAANPYSRWMQGAGFVSEDRKAEGLAVGLSLADNITLPRLQKLGPWKMVLPSRQISASQPWIEKIPIKCQSAAQTVQSLSGGNQQKVAIARLLHADVDILLLDEPTRGIDVGSKAQIYRLIDTLAAGDPGQGRSSKAILMVSSYLPELLGICDRIAVMCRGRLTPALPVTEWTEHTLMAAAIGKE